MRLRIQKNLSILIGFAALQSSSVFALDQIIRPYQSVRSAGMGGVRITTGLYDENFFNNPARVTANPESKFTLIQLTPIETTSNTLKEVSTLTGGGDTLQKVSDTAGKNLHNRTQIILPAYYLAASGDRKFALAFAMIGSIQTDAMVRQSYQTSISALADIGPALTVGRKFFSDDSLSIGVTGHLTYRLAAAPNYGILDYVRGNKITAKSVGGEGSMFDFDLGSTYRIGKMASFDVTVGGAIQNILGGDYSNLSFRPLKLDYLPPRQPRSYGVGVSASRSEWGFLNNTTFAFEVTDVLNNQNGSLFRLIHLGGETHWKRLAFRAGVNQGYLCGGLGLDFHYVNLDVATYGEELGLNAGTFEDRRYTFNIGFHI
jgi:hypothetical protein